MSRRGLPFILSLGTCLGAACSTDLADYPAAYERAYCEWQHGCHAYERVRDCIAARTIERDPELEYVQRAVAAGTVEYDPDAAEACLDAVAARGCEIVEPRPEEPCTRVFRGQVEAGGPCMSAYECADATCVLADECEDMCCVGFCGVPGLALGEPCDFSRDCAESAYCAFDREGFTACAPRLAAGGGCSEDRDCVAEARCLNNECHGYVLREAGEPCGSQLDICVAGTYCSDALHPDEATCREVIPLGAPCDRFDHGCAGFGTYCGGDPLLCTLLPGPGAQCEQKQCAAHAICDLSDAGGDEYFPGTCIALSGPGGPCDMPGYATSPRRCLGDLECDTGTCRLPDADTSQCPVPE